MLEHSLDWALGTLRDGSVVDALIVVLLLEMVLLLGWRALRGQGLGARRLLPNLMAGLCLLLAWRSAQSGGPVLWTVTAMLGAGLAHATDLRQRWRGAP